MSFLHLLEPEETIGNAWHRLVGGGGIVAHHPAAAVRFDEVAPQLAVFFRGLGGSAGVETLVRLAAARDDRSRADTGLRRRFSLFSDHAPALRLLVAGRPLRGPPRPAAA